MSPGLKFPNVPESGPKTIIFLLPSKRRMNDHIGRSNVPTSDLTSAEKAPTIAESSTPMNHRELLLFDEDDQIKSDARQRCKGEMSRTLSTRRRP